MAQRECYHCKQLVDENDKSHDCWTTTEAALTADLSEDLREAWERLRETAAEFGEQRIYASHNSIMFSRKSCYFFVRPKKSFLEVCVFLGRAVRSPRIRRVEPSSKTKFFHIIQVKHRDEVEAPFTDWLQEAYEFSGGRRPLNSRKRCGGRRRATAARTTTAAVKKRPGRSAKATRRKA